MGRFGVGVLCLCWCCVFPTSLCQRVNVATGKTYNQSSTYIYNSISHPPSYAANGDTKGDYFSSNCIHTAGDDFTPWWLVNLGRKYPVSDMTLWARTSWTNRLYPLNVTVDGQLCVRAYSNNNRKQLLTCTSAIYGQVVRLTRDYRNSGENISLNLCEVQIWVCPDGYYGDQCNLTCSSRTSRCSQCDQNGNCVVCSGHFKLPQCTGCDTGYYKSGTDCVECSDTCRNSQCDSDSGRCHVCPDGYYGDQCNLTCSSRISRCNQCDQNGNCVACSGNFKLPQCTGCDTGYYKSGTDCVKCSNTCRNSHCDSDSGTCQVNVATGKTYNQSSTYIYNSISHPPSYAANGDTKGDYFSSNCIHTAGDDFTPWWQVDLGRKYPVSDMTLWARTSWTNRLYPLNVTVDGQLCVRAYSNNNRKQLLTCTSAIYGQVVRLTRDYRNSGENISLNLCEVQIWGCDTGYYKSGTDCVECSNTCRNSQCDSDSGRCHGCNTGHYKSGTGCVECSNTCRRSQCDSDSGRCHGCASERQWGYQCEQSCGSHCATYPCDRYTGKCNGTETEEEKESLLVPIVVSILGAGLMITIGVTAAICWRRKSGGSAEKRTSAEMSSSGPNSPPLPSLRTVDEDGYCTSVEADVYEIVDGDSGKNDGRAPQAAPPLASSAPGVTNPDYQNTQGSGHAVPSSSSYAATDDKEICGNYDRLNHYSNEDGDAGLYSELADVTAET